ncbi:hypothetical protein J2Z21_009480 [Streptomyces griseochromogenes]|uniref:Uncharacterized protein n=1 Tax=Streptomyces griseochromogenes TaxID=68214 RepID=A0A1B1B057_9ACTN|nr:hypothetical protein [Streptomyces griseochromogenes]ANP52195.1 hypothetical protein AVL59_23910 [Streptomyces griseochromogenes]MBP2056462.1 hypothetical protein [Streptomyces griseochromogenes]
MLTRLPDTQRLGFVTYGRWTRAAIESTLWREPEDALRFMNVGQDVACSVTTTASGNLSSTIKPLDTTHLPALHHLLDHAQDESDSGETTLADLDISLGANTAPGDGVLVTDPYRIKAFAEWKQEAPAGTPPMPSAPPAVPTALIPGHALVLPEEAWQGLHVAFGFAGAEPSTWTSTPDSPAVPCPTPPCTWTA